MPAFNTYRRRLLQATSSCAIQAFLAQGLLTAKASHAAVWEEAVFGATSPGEALSTLGAKQASESLDIVFNTPEIAENGAKVEIEILSRIPGTQRITLLAEKNPTPICGIFEFSENVLPYVRTQIKLAASSRLRAVVQTREGKTWVALRDVTVTIGGCGA